MSVILKKKMKDIISLHKLYKSKKIYWIKTVLTLRKWVERDIKTNNILQTKTIESKGYKSGLRYYIPAKNIDLFIKAFEKGDLYEENNKKN